MGDDAPVRGGHGIEAARDRLLILVRARAVEVGAGQPRRAVGETQVECWSPRR